MSIAYSTRGGYTAENCGVLAVGDSSLDVRAALEDGKGVLVVSDGDTLTQAVLDEYPALKRVRVPDDPTGGLTDSLEGLPASALRDEARERGLKAGGSKDELLAAIRTHDANAAGDEQSAELANQQNEED
jgi:hypothetical protein